MNNYFDLRGSRRLSLLCDFVHEANYSPGCWNNMKRCCLSKLLKCIGCCLPAWIKNKSPATGITISKVLLFSTILMPVALVGSDMISDGGVLVQMWPYTTTAKSLAGEYAGDATAANITGTTTNSSSTELAGDQGGTRTVVGSNSTEVEQGGKSLVLDATLFMLVRGGNPHSLLFNSQLARVQLVVNSSEERADNSDDGVERA